MRSAVEVSAFRSSDKAISPDFIVPTDQSDQAPHLLRATSSESSRPSPATTETNRWAPTYGEPFRNWRTLRGRIRQPSDDGLWGNYVPPSHFSKSVLNSAKVI